ncbi:unnamed protein product, partial [Closterium sp. NIES-65]
IADLAGPEANQLILRSCLDVLFSDDQGGQSVELKHHLLASTLECLSRRSDFPTTVARALGNFSEPYKGFLKISLAIISLPVAVQLRLGVGLADVGSPFWKEEALDLIDCVIGGLPEAEVSALPGDLFWSVFLTCSSYPKLKEHSLILEESLCWRLTRDPFPIYLLPFLERSGSLGKDFVDLPRDWSAFVNSIMASSSASASGSGSASGSKAKDMATAMEELGFGCTDTVEHCKAVLKEHSAGSSISEADVARVMGVVAKGSVETRGGGGGAGPLTFWNVDVLVEAIVQLAPRLSWSSVINHLDYPGFFVKDQKGFSALVLMHSKATKELFPLPSVCSKLWANAEGQLSFLRHAVSAPPEVFTFAHSPRQIPPMDNLHGHKLPTGTPNCAWVSLDLLEALCRIGETGRKAEVVEVLGYPIKHCPEVLIVGLAQVKTPGGGVIQREVLGALVPLYLANNPNSSIVLHALWGVPGGKDVVMQAMVGVHASDPTSIARLLDVCQDLKALSVVLESTPFSFSLDLASLASRREYLNLEKWLQEALTLHRDSLFKACLQFLRAKLVQDSQDASAQRINLSLETLAIFFKVLQANAPQLQAPELGDELKALYASALQLHPALQTVAVPEQAPADVFASDIEEEANAYFQKIYVGQLSIEEVVDMLKRFNGSSVQREQDVFACMIQSLFDEYRFFPRYPDKELRITAVLFGSLVKHQLVSSITLGIALRCVLDALKKPSDSKMFSFGVTALEQFHQRLPEWPPYCTHILHIPHLQDVHPRLYALVQAAAAAPASKGVAGEGLSGAGGAAAAAAGGGGGGAAAGGAGGGAAGAGNVGGNGEGGVVAGAGAGGPSAVSGAAATGAAAGAAGGVSTGGAGGGGGGVDGGGAIGAGDKGKGASGGGDTGGVGPQDKAGKSADGVAGKGAVEGKDGAGGVTQGQAQGQAPGQGQVKAEQKKEEAEEKQGEQQDGAVGGKAEAGSAGRAAVQSPAKDSILFKPSGAALAPIGGSGGSQKLEALRPRGGSGAGVATRAPAAGFGHALNIETLMAAAEKRESPIEMPSSDAQDKVAFIINNIAAANLDQKAKEILEVLKEPFFPWFAQYLVMKRASIEPNFHELYLKFVDKMAAKSLQKEVVKATYENCKVLLRSELIRSSSEERSLLKNIGSWLGRLTIGRNQPLRANQINPKNLIIEAYEKGLMIAIIPFTSKILEPCANSVIYQPPNPWTVGILGLLVEIYSLPNLKLNLKFDIEVLFKNLGIEMKEVKPSQLLVGRQREMEGNPDFSNKDLLAAHLSAAGGAGAGGAGSGRGSPQPLVRSAVASPEPPGPAGRGAMGVPGAGKAEQQSSVLLPNLASYIVISPKLAPVAQQLQLARIVPACMDRAVREIVSPVVERSCSIACMTTRELVLKDFAMEADDSRTQKAANLMVASLAGSLALVTCKEPLRVAMANHLRTLLQAALAGAELEQVAQLLVSDNLDLGCAVIEKAASEKAVRDLEEVLGPALAMRRKQREALGAAYYDASIYSQGSLARIPEALRPKPGRLTLVQQRIYEDFAHLPWQGQVPQAGAAAAAAAAVLGGAGGAGQGGQQMGQGGQGQMVLGQGQGQGPQQVGQQGQQQVGGVVGGGAAGGGMGGMISGLPGSSMSPVPGIPGAASGAASAVAGPPGLAKIPMVAEGPPGVCWEPCSSHGPPRPQPAGGFISVATAQAVALFDDWVRVSKAAAVSKQTQNLLPPPFFPHLSPFPHPPQAQAVAQAVALFDDWVRVSEAAGSNDKAVVVFLSQLQHSSLLASEDAAERLFRTLTDMVVAHCLASSQPLNPPPPAAPGSGQVPPARGLNFTAVDMFSRLVVLLIKYYVDLGGNANLSKVNLLNKVLSGVVRVIHRQADERRLTNPRPFFRLLANLLIDLNAPDPNFDAASHQVLTTLAATFHALQPLRVPSFSFAWLELISHRSFMPKLLLFPGQKGWPWFQRLLLSLFKFMEPYLRDAELSDPIRLMYKGAIRVLLVLLHDFPEFLCDYHFSFCDIIPPTCIQMRNLVLSAFPRNMRLPDPFTPNLKVDLLPEISQPPRILSDVEATLRAKGLKAEVDEYLQTRQPPSFLSASLKQRLLLPPAEAVQSGTKYNVPLLNSLVLYVGMQAIQQLQSKATPQQLAVPTAPITHSAPMDVFQRLLSHLDSEGRYLFLNAVANQLRYPNNHTHYFSCVLLYLFAEANQEIVQEQITRVLLERLIVNRPHPWGLLITFIELIKNPRYNFWSHGFTRCAPEIKKLFESVARSCMGPPPKMDEDVHAAVSQQA